MNYETIKWQHNVHLIFHCEYSDFLHTIRSFLNSTFTIIYALDILSGIGEFLPELYSSQGLRMLNRGTHS